MIERDTREHAIAIILDRASVLYPDHIRSLVSNLPTDVEAAVEDFCNTVELSPWEKALIIKHNVSVPWELLQFAQDKELHGNTIRVELPPRTKKRWDEQ